MINAERLVRKIIADTQLPTFTDNAIKSKIHAIANKYRSKYSDQYWKVPNEIMQSINDIISNVALIEAEYDHRNQPPIYKKWHLVGGFITNDGKKRALLIIITASGAGSAKDPLDNYDIIVQVETMSPNNIHDNKSVEHLKNIGII